MTTLAGSGLLMVAPFIAQPLSAQPATPFSAGSTIEQAFTYSFPIAEMMRLRFSYLEDPANPARGVANEFVHGRELVDYRRRVVTTPNNDTLYSRGILDLSTGPVQIHVPDTNDRYYSIALYDIFTNHFATIGRRLTGTRENDFVVVGPNWQGELPDKAKVIRSPTDDVLVLTRIVVDGPEDLPAVRALQDGSRLMSLSKQPSQRPKGIAPVPGNAAAFVAIVNQALAINGVPSYEKPLLEQFAKVGICGKACSWDALPADVRAEWEKRFPAMLASLKKSLAGDSEAGQRLVLQSTADRKLRNRLQLSGHHRPQCAVGPGAGRGRLSERGGGYPRRGVHRRAEIPASYPQDRHPRRIVLVAVDV